MIEQLGSVLGALVESALSLATQNNSFVTAVGMAFPFLGIALSWWSFNWAEEGATPDSYCDPSPQTSVANEILKRGIRVQGRGVGREKSDSADEFLRVFSECLDLVFEIFRFTRLRCSVTLRSLESLSRALSSSCF